MTLRCHERLKSSIRTKKRIMELWLRRKRGKIMNEMESRG